MVRRWIAIVVEVTSAALLGGAACDGPEIVVLRSTARAHSEAGGTGGASTLLGGGSSVGGSIAVGCSGFKCAQVDCPGGGTTSLSGSVFDPAGKVPLYDVVVYVPSATLDAVPDGVSCGACDGTASGAPIAATLTDGRGRFVLADVPPGDDIPLVIQVGKWRRQITISRVNACVDNPIDDPNLTRLPRSQAEGHIPQIGVTTGHADAFECLLRKFGIDDSEFTTDAGSGRVHLYVGCANPDAGDRTGANRFAGKLGGGSFSPATSLWESPDRLSRYDILLFSCEGSQCQSEKSPYLANIKAYADGGGRLFLDHLHFYWLNHNEGWKNAADYVGVGTDLPDPLLAQIDRSFPKGHAFSDWLLAVGATTAPDELLVRRVQFSVREAYPPAAQQWIFTRNNPYEASGHAVEYMTMNTPVEAANSGGAGGSSGAGRCGSRARCGRVVFTDLHVATVTADFSDEGTPFPDGCTDPKTMPLTPQEKALEFMFFDLSSCVQAEREQPVPPVVTIK